MNNYSQFSESIILSPTDLEAKKDWIVRLLSLNEASVRDELFPDGYREGHEIEDHDTVTREHHKRIAAIIGESDAEDISDNLDCWPGFEWEIEHLQGDGPAVLSLLSGESFDLNNLITFVQNYLRKWDPKGVFRMTWANTSSRMEVGGFEGGWAVMSAEKHVVSLGHEDAEELAMEMAKEQKGHVLGLYNSAELTGMSPPPDVTLEVAEKVYGTLTESAAERAKKLANAITDLQVERDIAEKGLLIDEINSKTVFGGSDRLENIPQIPEGYENIYKSLAEGKQTPRTSFTMNVQDALRVQEILEAARKASGFDAERDHEETAKRAIESYLDAHKREGETIGDVRSRLEKEDTWTLTVDRISTCECDGQPGNPFTGVIFPCAVNDDESHSWVQRCDQCSTFQSDTHAAFFVARSLGLEVGFATPETVSSPRPYLKGVTFDQAVELYTKLRIR